MDNISGKTKKGIAWETASNVIGQVLQLIISIVLARLLAPKDFGIVVAASTFPAMIGQVWRMGLGKALIQRKDIQAQHFSTVFTVTVFMGIAITFVLISLSSVAARFFREPIVGSVMKLTSLTFIFYAFSLVPAAILNRDLEFKKIALINLASDVGGGILSVILALLGFGLWSLAIGKVASSVSDALMRCFYAWKTDSWLPRFGYNHKAFKELFHFGALVTVKDIVNNFTGTIDSFFIGRMLGTTILGFYSRAYQVATAPVMQMQTSTSEVLFSGFSRIQDDSKRLCSWYQKILCTSTLIAFPIFIGIHLVAPSFVNVVYGQKWMPIVIPLKILCIAGAVKSLYAFAVLIIDAKGHAKATMALSMINLLLLGAALFIGARLGINAVCIAILLIALLFAFLTLSLLMRYIAITWKLYFRSILPAVTYSAIMLFCIMLFQYFAGNFFTRESPQMLFSSVTIGALCYFLALKTIKFKIVSPLIDEAYEKGRKIIKTPLIGREIKSKILNYTGAIYVAPKIKIKRLTILAYHRILDFDHRYFYFDEKIISATPDSFDRQIKWVKGNYNIISFSDLCKGRIPSNPLIITFDDGYKDNYSFAYPILKKNGLAATMFLSTGYIGTNELFWWDEIAYFIKNASNKKFSIRLNETYEYYIQTESEKILAIKSLTKLAKHIPNEQRLVLLDQLKRTLQANIPNGIGNTSILNWAEILEMSKNRIEFGAHSRTHPILANMSASEMQDEIENSKKDIERNIHKEVVVFSYPSGVGNFFNATTKDLVKEAGYSYAVSYIHGLNDCSNLDQFCLKRIHVKKDDSFSIFKANALFPNLIKY